MDTVNYSDYISFSLLTIAWCALHSAMISVTVTNYLKQHHLQHYRFYRLFFNAVSLITLALIIIYQQSISTENIFDWQGYLRIPQFIFISLGILLFYLGARKYDAKRFLGLSQLKESTASTGITQSGELDTSGILSVIRHPWYAGFILVLWARPMDYSTLILNTIFTAYLIVGSLIEEKKLLREFGDEYKTYQEKVSMLIPFKWIKS